MWIMLAGRGWGKSWSGAGYTVDEIRRRTAKRVALIGGTAADVRDVMIEGPSGVIAASRAEGMEVEYQPSKRRVIWPEFNATATAFSAAEPERLRGPQHDLAWGDELRTWKNGGTVLDNLMLGLRIGEWPRFIGTTTPLGLKWLKKLLAHERTYVSGGSTMDNLDNLAPLFRETVLDRYQGTRLAQQEIEGLLIEDVEGALWLRETILNQRWDAMPEILDEKSGEWVPDIRRGVVSVDPAVTSSEESDETGLIGAFRCGDNKIYVAHDWSLRARPSRWAKKACDLYYMMEADRMIAEVNNGGDLVEEMIRVHAPEIRVKQIRASKGKHIRAEPVAAAMEKDDVRLLGAFPELEDQMANMTVDGYVGDGSPDRLDAMVYAVMELLRRTGKMQLGGV